MSIQKYIPLSSMGLTPRKVHLGLQLFQFLEEQQIAMQTRGLANREYGFEYSERACG